MEQDRKPGGGRGGLWQSYTKKQVEQYMVEREPLQSAVPGKQDSYM